MQKIAIFLFSVIFLLNTTGCGCGLDDCKCVDCAGNDNFNVQFLSKTDSSDLLVTGAIVADSLQVFRVKGTKSELFDWLQLRAVIGGGPFLSVDPDVTAYIFRYTPTDRDTLLLQSHATPRGECCGGNTVLDFALFKGDTVRPVLDNRGFILTLLK